MVDTADLPEPQSSKARRCRWVCPICGTSEVTILTPGRSQTKLLNDLWFHIRFTVDEDHGSIGSCPDDINRGALQEDVTCDTIGRITDG